MRTKEGPPGGRRKEEGKRICSGRGSERERRGMAVEAGGLRGGRVDLRWPCRAYFCRTKIFDLAIENNRNKDETKYGNKSFSKRRCR